MAPRKGTAADARKRDNKATKRSRNLTGDKKTIDTEKQTMNMVSQTQSPLMGLPAELRNEIYELAFVAKPPGNLKYFRKKDGRVKAPRILMTCKQAYKEAVGVFYATASFQFATAEHAFQYLIRVPIPRLPLIKDVRINIQATPHSETGQRIVLVGALTRFKAKLAEKAGIVLAGDVIKVPDVGFNRGEWTHDPSWAQAHGVW